MPDVYKRAAPLNSQVSEALTDFALGYENGAYFADVLCPRIATDKYIQEYQLRQRKDLITPVADLIDAEAEVSRVDYELTTQLATCLDRGLKSYVTTKEEVQSDDPMTPRRRKTADLMNRMMLNHEIRVADLYNTVGSYAAGNVVTPAAAWSDAASGEPLVDLKAARRALPPAQTGLSKIVCLMTELAWDELTLHPDFAGIVPRDQGGFGRMEQFMNWFRIDEFYVTEAEKNTANRGLSPTIAPVWDDDKVILARVPTGETPPTPDAMMFGGTFTTRQPAADGEGLVVTEWLEPGRGSGEGVYGIKVTRAEVPVILQNDMAVLINGV